MQIKNSITAWVATALSITLIVCIIHAVVNRPQKPRQPWVDMNKAIKDTLQNRLNNASYEPVTIPIAADLFDDVTGISDAQKAALREELNVMLKAYTDGSAVACFSLLEPDSLSWTYNTDFLASVRTKGYAPDNASDNDVLKLMLDLDSSRTFYKAYFQGIIYDPEKINKALGTINEYGRTNTPGIQIITTNQTIPIDKAMYVLTNYITLGVREADMPTITHPDAQEVLRIHGTITYANIYWLIKPGDGAEQTNACFSLIAQLYFEPNSGKWIFSALARGNVWEDLKYKMNLIF